MGTVDPNVPALVSHVAADAMVAVESRAIIMAAADMLLKAKKSGFASATSLARAASFEEQIDLSYNFALRYPARSSSSQDLTLAS